MYTYIPDAQRNTPCVSVCLKIYKQTYSQTDQYTTKNKTYNKKNVITHADRRVYSQTCNNYTHECSSFSQEHTDLYIVRIICLIECVYLRVHAHVSIQLIIYSFIFVVV